MNRLTFSNRKLILESLEDRRLLSVGVGNFVWNDLNSDGVQNAGEPGIAGVGVELYSTTDSTIGNSDDVLRGRAVTDANGNYSISNVPNGLSLYEIFRAPVGHTFTTEDAGGNDSFDSDVDSTGTTALFTISAGQTDSTRDVGLVGNSPGFGFAMSAGGANYDRGFAVTTDAAGNIYETGTFEGTVDFDPGPGVYNLTSGTYGDIFVAKYSPGGALIWARRMGGSSSEYGRGIAVAADGSVYTTGNFNGSADFDPGSGSYYLTSAGLSEIFVSKLDSSGNFVWARRLGGTGTDAGDSIALASDGSVCITGTFAETADFDPGTGVYNITAVGNYDIFVAKLDSAGNFIWACGTGGTNYDYATGVSVDSVGNVYATGYYRETVDFDPGAGTFPLTSAGNDDFFVLKLNSTGSFLWAKSIGGTSSDQSLGIALAPDGGVLTAGYFSGPADFDPGPATYNLTGSGGFISKLDAEGNFVWARQFNGSPFYDCFAIAVSSDGCVYTTGSFYGLVDFDPGVGNYNLQSAGSGDMFISKLDSSGTFIWARSMGGTDYDTGSGIAIAADGSAIVTGDFEGTADFDPSEGVFNLTSLGQSDRILVKTLPDITPTTPPTVLTVTPTTASQIVTSAINIDITFSEVVQGVDATDLVLTGSASASAVKGIPLSLSGSTWRFPVSGLATGDLSVSLAPDAGDIEDISGNDLANVVWSYTVLLGLFNTNPISIPSTGAATPYPSTIDVSGLVGAITDVNVTLTGLTHTYPSDIDILLVGPAGQKIVILSDVGSGTSVSGVNLVLDDAASNSLTTSKLTSGTYKPTNLESSTDMFSSPAPAGPYAVTLAAFNGTNPNGVWSLYVMDDATGDLGSIAGGWSLTILTNGGSAVIGDKVWSDLDSDGVQDSGEAGVANWEVYLDSNGNGQWDSGEPKTATDASGNYAFANLVAGTYRVAEVQRTGWTQTAPASPGYYTVVLAAGETRSDVDFGNHQLPTQSVAIIASVDGTVQDKEPDGTFETLDTTSSQVTAGSHPSGYSIGDRRATFEFNLSSLAAFGEIVEASFSFYVAMYGQSTGSTMNYSVYGYAGDGVVSLSDATASATLIAPYHVTNTGLITLPLDASFFQSLRGSANYAGVMIRITNVDYSSVSIRSLEYGSGQKPTLNLSALVIPTAEIHSSVWSDIDSDAVQDSGEAGVPNWEVYLDSNTNGQWDSGEPKTATDASGNYAFTGLAAGTYRVAEVQRAGWTQTAPASPGYYTVTLAGGETRSDLNFGNHQLPSQIIPLIASVDGEARDADSNGVFETLDTTNTLITAGKGNSIGDRRGLFEFNISSLVSVGTIVDATFDFSLGGWSSVTGASLNYSIYAYSGDGAISLADATAAASYVGVFHAGTLSTFSVPLDVAVLQSLRSSGNYIGLLVRLPLAENTDVDIYSVENTLSLILKPTLKITGLTLPPAEVRSSVWGDLDGDGIQDAGEPGIAGAAVELYSSVDATIGNGDDVLQGRAISDTNGNYTIVGIPPNLNYYAIFRAPVGYTFTVRDTGGDDAQDSDADSAGMTGIFSLTNGQSDTTRDAGLSGYAPGFGFALHVGASNGSSGNAMATDAAGNIYLTGYFSGTADFDAGPGISSLISSNSNDDIFIVKYSPNGALIWARRLGGASYDRCEDIAVAADGSVYLTGWFQSTVDFDPGPGVYNITAINGPDAFILKLDAFGNFVWARRIGGSDTERGNSIALAADGSAYIAGVFSATVDFDPGTGVFNLTSAGDSDIFVSKLSASGDFVWACKMGGSGTDFGNSIAVAADGSVIASGNYNGTADFDPSSATYNLTSAGGPDLFVVKLDASGAFAWARSMGGSGSEVNYGLALASDGSVFTTGIFTGTADFDPGNGTTILTSSGLNEAFVSKLDVNGNFLRAARIGGVNNDEAKDIVLAADGSVFLTGYFVGSADFDPSTAAFNMTSTGSFDVFILKLDGDCNFAWARHIGSNGYASSEAIALSPEGSVYTTGNYWGVADFDTGSGTFNIQSTTTGDLFLSKNLPDHAPTNIGLSANSINENQPNGTRVGTLTSNDPDSGESFIYSLVSGTGSDDNAFFTIDANGQLKTAAVLDYETKASYSIRVRTTDYSGMRFEKAFTVTVTDLPETLTVGAANWTDAGVTVKLGGDGKLHAYRTGGTIDAVPPHNPAMVTGIQITGRNNADDELTLDFSGGNLLPAGGLDFNSGSHLNGDSIFFMGTAGNDEVSLTNAQIVLAGASALAYNNVEFFGFDLSLGKNTLLVDHTTLRINRNNALSASTKVTVDGGTLDFNGKSTAIGDLMLINGGTVNGTAINNATTTVASGTLTAASIVCDTLIIGSPNVPVTRTWDGGGADNTWTTAANWVGDTAPKPGDNLVFPAAAAKLESVNDYPLGTIFGSIEVSEGNYSFQNGIVSASAIHVTSGTLSTPSIICDTLIIGSSGAASRAIVLNTTNSEKQAFQSQQAAVDNLSAPASNTVIPTSADTPLLVSVFPPVVRQEISTPEFVSKVSLPEKTIRQHNEQIINGILSKKLLTSTYFAGISSMPSIAIGNSFQLANRLKDSVYGEMAELPKKQPIIAIPSARSLALRSIARDSLAIAQLESELLVGKYFCKQAILPRKAVDKFHADLLGAGSGGSSMFDN